MLSITCVLNFILSTIIIININNKNQIYLARIKNYEQDTDKYIHFSIGDVIDIFADITHNSYNSIFENKTLKYLKELNELYGSKFSMYCFYEKKITHALNKSRQTTTTAVYTLPKRASFALI